MKKFEPDWAEGKEDMLQTRDIGQTDGLTDHYRAPIRAEPWKILMRMKILQWLCRWSVSLCYCGFLTMCLLLKHWPLITLLMTCKQVTVYFFPTRKPVPAGFPSMCISPTLLLTFVFTSLDNTSLCLWVPFEKGWVQANLVVTDFAFWKKNEHIYVNMIVFMYSSCIVFQFNFSLPKV